MGRVRFRGNDMVRIKVLDRNIVSGSTKYVDQGTQLTLQNQDVRVIWPVMWRMLEVESAAEGSTSCVWICCEICKDFPVHTGVQQGYVFCSLPFNTVINAIMRSAFEGRRGIKYAEDKFVTDLMFVDDSSVKTPTCNMT